MPGPGAVPGGSERSGPISGHLRVVPAVLGAPESGSVWATCSTVACDEGRDDAVAEALRKAMSDWIASGDPSTLRRQLLALLMLVEAAG